MGEACQRRRHLQLHSIFNDKKFWEDIMRLKAPLIAGLFSCVALVGCTGSDNKDTVASQGTFGGVAKDLNTQASQPSDTISQAVQVKQAQGDADIAALRVTLGEVQQTLKTLEAGVTAAKTENDLTKLRRFNLPQAEDDAAALLCQRFDATTQKQTIVTVAILCR